MVRHDLMCEALELRCPTKLSRFNSFKWIRNPEFDTRFLKLPALLKESRTRSRSRKKPDKNIKNVFLWKFRPEILSEDSPYLNGTLTFIFLKSTLRNFSICGTNKGILIEVNCSGLNTDEFIVLWPLARGHPHFCS